MTGRGRITEKVLLASNAVHVRSSIDAFTIFIVSLCVKRGGGVCVTSIGVGELSSLCSLCVGGAVG